MPQPKPIHSLDYAPEDFITVAKMLESIVLHGIDPVVVAMRSCGEQLLESEDDDSTFGALNVSEENLLMCSLLLVAVHQAVVIKKGPAAAAGYLEAAEMLKTLHDAAKNQQRQPAVRPE